MRTIDRYYNLGDIDSRRYNDWVNEELTCLNDWEKVHRQIEDLYYVRLKPTRRADLDLYGKLYIDAINAMNPNDSNLNVDRFAKVSFGQFVMHFVNQLTKKMGLNEIFWANMILENLGLAQTFGQYDARHLAQLGRSLANGSFVNSKTGEVSMFKLPQYDNGLVEYYSFEYEFESFLGRVKKEKWYKFAKKQLK